MRAREWLVQSYRIPVIWGGVIAIGLLGLLAGILAWIIPPPAAHGLAGVQAALDDPTARERAVVAFIADHRDDDEALLGLVRLVWSQPGSPALALTVRSLVAAERGELASAAALLEPTPGDFGKLVRFAQGLDGMPEPAGSPPLPLPGPELLARAAVDPPDRWSNRLVGDRLYQRGELRAAAQAYARAGRDPAAHGARTRHLWALSKLDDRAAIAALLADPAYAAACPSPIQVQQAVVEQRWLGVLRHLPAAMYYYSSVSSIVLALVGGTAWFAIVWHCLHRLARRREMLVLALLAVTAGVASTWLTLTAVYITEDGFGFRAGETAFEVARYMVAGVGLREETCKLLCFLPLAPWLVRRHPPLAWFGIASLVGLGFAVAENIQYLEERDGALSSRFLTANFFHIALTGLIGLAFCEALADRRQWPQFASVFVLGVCFHGLYNSFILADLLARDWSWVCLILLLAVAVHYFRVLRHLRLPGRSELSHTALFAWGLSLTVAVSWAVYAGIGGPLHASQVVFPGLLATVLISIAFVRGIADPLAR